jgi:hypothetical protein
VLKTSCPSMNEILTIMFISANFPSLIHHVCSQNKISCFQEDNNMLENVIMRSHFSLSKTFLGFVHSPISHAKHFGKDRSWWKFSF